jgi:hypothetical protein
MAVDLVQMAVGRDAGVRIACRAMNLLRASSTVLIGVSLMALAACGGKEAASTAAPGAPAATTVAADASAAADTNSATGAGNDTTLCNAAKNAHLELRKQFTGSPSPEAAKKALTDMGEALTALAATGGNGKVATAISQYAAAVTKAVAAADPGDDPAMGKAGEELRAACKAAGVDGF